jgi:hypothetical protein
MATLSIHFVAYFVDLFRRPDRVPFLFFFLPAQDRVGPGGTGPYHLGQKERSRLQPGLHTIKAGRANYARPFIALEAASGTDDFEVNQRRKRIAFGKADHYHVKVK